MAVKGGYCESCPVILYARREKQNTKSSKKEAEKRRTKKRHTKRWKRGK
jgi:hypothetical protein